MNTFEMLVTGGDNMGYQWLQNVVNMANLGAVMKPGTIPNPKFPHSMKMILTASEPPTPSASIRVFDANTLVEIKAGEYVPVVPVAATFSTEEEDEETEEEEELTDSNLTQPIPESVVDAGTTVTYTLEQLTEMKWEEVREIAKAVGVTGRDRDKVTKAYLQKVSVSE